MISRFPLLFLAIGLSSCAPLPPLVTDPVDEEKPAEAPPQAKTSEVPALPVAAPTENPSESATKDSTDETKPFAPISPTSSLRADSSTSGPAFRERASYPAKVLPNDLQRDFRVGILVGVSKVEISGNSFTLGTRFADFPSGKTLAGLQKLSAKKGHVQSAIGLSDSVWIVPVESSRISVGNKEYRGKILVVNSSGKLNVINVLPVEEYLKGVVPHEIGKLDSSMFEALKVQAVAARTYAYRHYNSRISQGFDVYATVQDQVYNGSSGESPLTNAAIDSTKGLVLTYNGNLIEAYYHSTCGGYTEGVETWGLAPVPYLQSQNDMKSADSAWCTGPHSSWKKVYSEKELVAMFKRNFKEARAEGKSNFGGIQQIEIKSTFPGGRIAELEVLTDKGIFTVKGDRTRWLFKDGSKILFSSKFKIEKNGKVWVLDGSGFGHGIGMCQMGTRERAKAGQAFDAILKAYYPGTTLECIQSAE